jgi:hypothetical protein
MVTASTPARERTSLLQTLRGWLEDVTWLLVGVLLFPLIILLIGTPVALLVRGLIEIVRR